MKKIFLLIGLMVAFSSISFSQDQDLAKEIFKKYQKIKSYALEVRKENIAKTKEIEELKEMMVQDILKGFKAYEELSSEDLTYDDSIDLYQYSIAELYELEMELIQEVTKLIMEQ